MENKDLPCKYKENMNCRMYSKGTYSSYNLDSACNLCYYKGAEQDKPRVKKHNEELARRRVEEKEKERLRNEKEKRRKLEDREKGAIKCIWKHNIDYLYHMTHIDNMSSILEYGLLSYNKLPECGTSHKDISMEDVQEKRHKKRDPINNKPLHDYASLYFNPKNVMLSVRQDMQEDIVILGIDPELLIESETIFTNGNAASDDTKFYKGVENLNKLLWDIIKKPYDPLLNHRVNRRIKCAEVLVPLKIPAERIKKIFCHSKEQCLKVSGMVPHNISISIGINKNLYYKKFLYKQ